MKNMAILGIGVILIPIGFIVDFIFEVGDYVLEIFVFLGFVMVVIFINTTFYRNRNKAANLVLIMVIFLGIVQILLFYLYSDVFLQRGFHHYLTRTFDLIYVLLVYEWFAYSCYSAYKRLKDQNIKPWIKARYRLLAISSFVMGFHSIPEFFLPKNVEWGDPNHPISLLLFGVVAIMSIVYGIIFSISWFMPRKLKNYYNKEYKKETDKEYTEEELMNLIKDQLNEKG
ncbi:MAG: hypothetical protein GF383_09000 [Candidatus Lokiarchaeota archaeon]|nr:hypothetical protein [Candidatus Lokiarchaeota archaeon]MBD3340572.1 hypothetical protein [Candidatus Lokiarchaeota archaeon]